MSHRHLSIVFVLASLLAEVGSCRPFDAPPEPVRIGAVYPLSGAQAAAGLAIEHGIELALEIVNEPHPELAFPLAPTTGLPAFGGRRLEVVFGDDGSTQDGARAQATHLLADEHVVALMGAYESDKTRIASEVAEAAQVPFLNAASTDPALTDRGFRWFFRTTPSDATFVADAFQLIADVSAEHHVNLERVAVVHESSDFGMGFTKLVTASAPLHGAQVVADVTTRPTSEPPAADVRRIRDARSDALLFAVYSADAVRYVEEMKRQDYAPPLVWADDAGFTSPDAKQTLGADADFIVSREVWSLDVTRTNPLAAQVNALYRARYGTDLDGNSVRGFIGMMTLAEAVNRAASTDPAAIRDALRATDVPAERLIAPWRGIRFDDTGQNTLGDGIAVQMIDGRYTTVWPSAVAVRPLVFPFPPWGARGPSLR